MNSISGREAIEITDDAVEVFVATFNTVSRSWGSGSPLRDDSGHCQPRYGR